MDVRQQIIALERSALDRWIRSDPDGYLNLYAQDATYFDPFGAKQIRGLDELKARVAPMRGMKLPFTDARYEMVNPAVHLGGHTAVLTYNLLNYGKPIGQTVEAELARWNATQVYEQSDGTWRIIHTHWSFTQPAPPAPPK